MYYENTETGELIWVKDGIARVMKPLTNLTTGYAGELITKSAEEKTIEVVFEPRRKKGAKMPHKVKKQRTCGKCGAVGHRADRCDSGLKNDLADKMMDDTPRDNTGEVSENFYNQARAMKAKGENSLSVARALEITLQNVNLIFGAISYKDYLKARNKVEDEGDAKDFSDNDE